VASERQIAANRRNAPKSTGPQSRAGRKRASGNAYRHGLSLSITSSPAFAKQLDKLARKIAGDTEDVIILDRARAAAEALLHLARVRRAKVALIAHVQLFGALDAGGYLRGRVTLPEPIDPLSTMPSQEPDRSIEAMRRALPELLKLDRYERRASAMRDRAIYDIVEVGVCVKNN
jgi:hypothetical protein